MKKSRSKVDTKTETSDKLKDANQKLRQENRELKKENKLLKRDVNRLKKELNKDPTNWNPSIELEELIVAAKVEGKPDKICKDCKTGTVSSFEAGIFQINICDACGSKSRIKNTKDLDNG